MTTLAPERIDRLHLLSQGSFGGVSCAQIWADFYLWEVILNERAGADQEGLPRLRAIVELGTWQGGFSLYLAAQARARGLDFRTYDIVAPDCEIPGFVQLDIFREREQIGRFLSEQQPLVLLCDGGNKPRELRTFSRYLSPDSLIVVHDWGTEILTEDVPDNVEEIWGDLCDEIGSVSRVFRVRDDA